MPGALLGLDEQRVIVGMCGADEEIDGGELREGTREVDLLYCGCGVVACSGEGRNSFERVGLIAHASVRAVRAYPTALRIAGRLGGCADVIQIIRVSQLVCSIARVGELEGIPFAELLLNAEGRLQGERRVVSGIDET